MEGYRTNGLKRPGGGSLGRWLVVHAACLVCACQPPAGTADAATATPEAVDVAIGPARVRAQLALDETSRRRGLSQRESLGDDEALLSVLPRPMRTAVWARGIDFGFDAAFLDASGQVLAVHRVAPEPPRAADESPEDYEARLRKYDSRFPVRFVLTLAEGRSKSLGLQPGARIRQRWDELAALAQ